ncbi:MULTISPECIES: PEP-CTERM sorting domain-containing protein [Aliiglaciecola]|uniref:PEP-CTERM sorting domain-containing protein n=1 Tax=Aliiglaciecola TaxID=1406885 RepID=UPI001C097B17|nr:MULTISPECIES: PEP-CTERM sorting domain-containing protein [Aliiglaciecola]MBU2880320.1 PEP-CTERM sorting domain-containing protein [Aliiglaciecola lipolytica]MDO6712890.1 PEP-CTERM sorting domain-containing protein [Aliiglaciecola sp. 2_MG-2023]MDO6752874.1 PEP-CTERM sorting domain-containing protein [Aliiglaciecola sp. 1_MG-2023]
MIKKIIAGLSLVGMSLSAQSAIIVDEANITGADMAGIEVTALFGDGTSESGIWSAFPDVVLGTGDPIADAEGFSGGVVTSTWSLTQQGFSSGNVSPAGGVFGAWTLTNIDSASDIVGFSIDGFAGDVAFDIDSGSENTPYSSIGVSFASATVVDSVAYSDQVSADYGDLFFTLDVLFGSSSLAIGDDLVFVTDTDTVKVPEPATTAMILSGLLFGAARLRARK